MAQSRKHLLFSLPVQLLILCSLALLFGNYVNPYIKAFFYSISLTIKSILMVVLPYIIFSYIIARIISFKAGIIKFIFFVLTFSSISTLISVVVSYPIDILMNQFTHVGITKINDQVELLPLWEFNLPTIIPNVVALLAGLISAVIFSQQNNNKAIKLTKNLTSIADFIINKCFMPIVPIFVLGFIFKLDYEGHINIMLHKFTFVFCIIIFAQIAFIFLLFIVAHNLNMKEVFASIKVFLPSAITAFSTTSSSVALPMTLEELEKISKQPNIVKAVFSIISNIHGVGDNFIIPILALAILQAFGHPLPDFQTYCYFGLLYFFGTFALAGIPAGGILVMLPVLKESLGMSLDMLSLLTTAYIILDPICSAVNVYGNAALSMVICNYYPKKWLSSIIKNK